MKYLRAKKRAIWLWATALGVVAGLAVWLLGFGWGSAAPKSKEPIQALSVTRDGWVWVGTKNGLRRTDGRGRWEESSLAQGVRHLLVDPGNQANMYALTEAGPIYASSDSGTSWTPTGGKGLPAGRIRAFGYDPSGPTRLVALVADHGYYQSENRGQSWRRMGTDLPDATSLVVNPLDPRTVLVGTPSGLYESTNQGVRFVAVSTAYDWRLKGAVHSMAVTGDRGAILAATARGLFRTKDGGRAWLPVGESGLSDVVSVGVDPWRPHIVVAGSSTGDLVISRDSGETWEYIR